ncbi:hypothetical protein D7X30_38860 [Corallococcus sp. AB011P]|nr:hypothetical protein D7X30_38860 [Corallococcus sp. AB011P]
MPLECFWLSLLDWTPRNNEHSLLKHHDVLSLSQAWRDLRHRHEPSGGPARPLRTPFPHQNAHRSAEEVWDTLA